jgi:hypothetical protein
MPDQPTYAQLWRPLYVVVVVVINGAVYTEWWRKTQPII